MLMSAREKLRIAGTFSSSGEVNTKQQNFNEMSQGSQKATKN
jgi:hypothetical protein